MNDEEDIKRRARSNRIAVGCLGLFVLWLVVEIISISVMGKNASVEFRTVQPTPRQDDTAKVTP
jgi:hypothetical protein